MLRGVLHGCAVWCAAWCVWLLLPVAYLCSYNDTYLVSEAPQCVHGVRHGALHGTLRGSAAWCVAYHGIWCVALCCMAWLHFGLDGMAWHDGPDTPMAHKLAALLLGDDGRARFDAVIKVGLCLAMCIHLHINLFTGVHIGMCIGICIDIHGIPHFTAVIKASRV